jgi:anti-sigma regulatory factor (Ser/Thr protein kinase)
MATTALKHVEPDGVDLEMVLTIRATLHAPAVARAFVRSGAEHLGAVDTEDAVLLTSEAVTNSVEHAHTEAVEVSMGLHDGLIRVTVVDDDPELPHMPELDPTTVGGFGLRLIDLLAYEWGVEVVRDDGKCVWFDVRLASIPTPAA